MRVLIAVYSHSGDSVNGNHQKIRDTWGRHVAPWDLRFMIGHRGAPGWQAAPDEILIPCDRACADDWLLWNLYYQEMTIETLRWSLDEGYDHTFLCCNDTFIVPSKLRQTDFANYDYSGIFYPPNGTPLGSTFPDPFYKRPAYTAADAGTGFFMSRKAARARRGEQPDSLLRHQRPVYWAGVGTLHQVGRYHCKESGQLPSNCRVALSRRGNH